MLARSGTCAALSAWRGAWLLACVALAGSSCGHRKVAPVSSDGGAGSDDGPPHLPSGLTRGGGTDVVGPYVWKSVVIRGGGFVTGISFSPVARDTIYARTDVGGAYRWDAATGGWIALTDWIDRAHSNLVGIESIVADPVAPDVVYVAAGTYLAAGDGVILRSTDRGHSFTVHDVPIPMGGNQIGRSMGERLAVDPNLPSKLYFATRTRGLWMSTTSGSAWDQVPGFPATGDQNVGLSFVLFDGRSGTPGRETRTIYVGVGSTAAGSNLYRSNDGGATFRLVPGGPTGLMPHHAVLGADGVIVLAYNNGPGPNDITSGAIWKVRGDAPSWTDVTPGPLPARHGFGGVTVDPAHPGTMMASTIDWWAPDEIYRSVDGGATWLAIAAQASRDTRGVGYLNFGGPSPSATGWMGDIEIDPFDPSRVLYVTGQGIWGSGDVTAADGGGIIHWSFEDVGLEETVTLDLMSPPAGAPLLSAVGDIAGFRHDDLDATVPGGMFANPISQNTNSLDFAQDVPAFMARVGRARLGTTDRRGAYSTDGGTTWTPFAAEPAGSGGEGTIAVSADASTLLWAARSSDVAVSRDRGATWTASVGLPGNARPVSDRVNPARFYAFGAGQFFVSTDRGATFTPTATDLPSGRGRLRPSFAAEGDVWLVSTAGLFHSTDSGSSFTRSPRVDECYALGFGQSAPGATIPAIYQSGRVDGVVGLFRSDDGGDSWTNIGDDDHQFGQINAITGDPRQFGRVYLGTGGRGIIYGDPR